MEIFIFLSLALSFHFFLNDVADDESFITFLGHLVKNRNVLFSQNSWESENRLENMTLFT